MIQLTGHWGMIQLPEVPRAPWGSLHRAGHPHGAGGQDTGPRGGEPCLTGRAGSQAGYSGQVNQAWMSAVG